MTIHIPPDLLQRVDQRAQRLGTSRSGFIVDVLRRELEPSGGWSPGFLDLLRRVTPEDQQAADELVAVLGKRRSRKGPPRL